MLYSTLAPENSLTAYSAAAGEQSLRLPLFGGLPGSFWQLSISSSFRGAMREKSA